MENALSFSAEPGHRYLEVTGLGLWTAQQAETHFQKLGVALRRMRARSGSARVLVDLREGLVQPADTAAVMSRETMRIYQQGDRVAVLCAQALLAMQIKHAAKVYDLATFSDRKTGLAWLLAEDRADADRQVRSRMSAAS